MLEMVLDRHMIVILIGGAAVVGVVSKILAGASLRRLVRAAGNMGKSSHPLIRLVKARFEQQSSAAWVQNVEVFVEKYLHEYRTAGLKLHTWRRLERAGVWLCLLFGLAGAGAWYGVYGMSDGGASVRGRRGRGGGPCLPLPADGGRAVSDDGDPQLYGGSSGKRPARTAMRKCRPAK